MSLVVDEGGSLDRLKASLDPLAPVFLLVDPLSGEPVPLERAPRALDEVQELRENRWQRQVARVPLSDRTKLPENLHPYVVELSGIDDPWIASTLARAQAERDEAQADGLEGVGGAAHTIGGWLQSSSLSADQLAQQLAQLMRLRVNDCVGVQASYLRLADRRVLGLTRHLVGDTRIAAGLQGLQRWIYLNVMGRFDELGELGADHQVSEDEESSLRLSYEEWQRIKPGESIQRALAMWLGELAQSQPDSPELGRPERDLYAAVAPALAATARAATMWRHRFKQEHDRHVWTALSLLHPELSHAPTHCDRVNLLMRDKGTSEAPAEPVRYMHTEISDLLLKARQVDATKST